MKSTAGNKRCSSKQEIHKVPPKKRLKLQEHDAANLSHRVALQQPNHDQTQHPPPQPETTTGK